ncbi:hypothetical protein TPA0906_36420 [Streptomyces olivaceus]|nr:hypothetical protein TPA0906_36420 [Streptomyces olivaceus]
MSLSSPAFPPPARPYRAPSARLALRPLGSSPTRVGPDGAWWPRTRDLAHELCELAGVLDPLWGRITHVAANPRHWFAAPHGPVLVNDHEVVVDWFAPGLDPHRVLLRSYTAGDWDLLVVPPRTAAPSAARLMAVAGEGPAGAAGRPHGLVGPQSRVPGSLSACPVQRLDSSHERAGSAARVVSTVSSRRVPPSSSAG